MKDSTKTKIEDWDKEFDKEFEIREIDEIITLIFPTREGSNTPIYTTQRNEIKRFYRQKFNEYRKEVKRLIDKKKKGVDLYQQSVNWKNGWIQALNEILEIINPPIK